MLNENNISARKFRQSRIIPGPGKTVKPKVPYSKAAMSFGVIMLSLSLLIGLNKGQEIVQEGNCNYLVTTVKNENAIKSGINELIIEQKALPKSLKSEKFDLEKVCKKLKK